MTYQDVVDIIRNTATAVNPSGTFVHGRKSDGSLEFNNDSPWIILLEPQPNPLNNNKDFIETISFPIMFLTQDTPETTPARREELKESMFVLSREFLALLDEEDLLDVNYAAAQPEIRQLAGTLTGFSWTLNVTYPYTIDCDSPTPAVPSVYLFASKTCVYEGEEIELAWIAYGVDTVFINNGVGNVGKYGFTTVTIEADTTYTATVTNSAGTDTVSILIDVVVSCPDGSAVLKNTAGTTISTTPIPSDDIVDITAPDATAVIKNSTPTIIDTELIPSGVSEDITLADIALLIKDQNNNTLSNTQEAAAVNITKTINVVSPLTVDFSVNDTTPDTNVSVQFTDLTVGATVWSWMFGDGEGSTLQNPTHTYKYAGTYTVTLHADDGSSGGYLVKTNYITVTLETVLQTNIQAHYKADENMLISQWNDATANAFHLVQASGLAQPVKNANQLNGYSCLTGDGINDRMVNNNAAFTRTQPSTIFLVVRDKRQGNANNDVMADSGTVTGSFMVYQAAAAATKGIISGGTAIGNIGVPRGTAEEDFHIFQAVWNGAGSIVQYDDFTEVTGNPGANNAVGLSLFAQLNGNAAGNYDICEGIVYSDALNSATRTTVKNYLKSKFALW